jgi:hypothetical protein
MEGNREKYHPVFFKKIIGNIQTKHIVILFLFKTLLERVGEFYTNFNKNYRNICINESSINYLQLLVL